MEKFKELYAQYDFNFTDDDVKKEMMKFTADQNLFIKQYVILQHKKLM